MLKDRNYRLTILTQAIFSAPGVYYCQGTANKPAFFTAQRDVVKRCDCRIVNSHQISLSYEIISKKLP